MLFRSDYAAVFDEIDTGVSGIAAQRVGEKLYSLSLKRQILSVTHLPQIAVLADTHFLIEKSEAIGRTYTNVTVLDDIGRVYEIARLMGGDNVSEKTLTSASDQIKKADEYKGKLK